MSYQIHRKESIKSSAAAAAALYAAENGTEKNMIINLNKAILHILDLNSGISVYSRRELDLEDNEILTYLCGHIDKVFGDPGLRPGVFRENSGFLYKLKEYKNAETDFAAFSEFAANRIYELIGESDDINSCDVIICECIIGEQPHLALFKCDSKAGFSHRVVKEDGVVKNEIINYHALLPAASQRFNDYAFINTEDFSIAYKPKKISIDGEKTDLFADGLFECDFDYSAKESFNAITKLAKKITEEYAGSEIDTQAKIKQYVKDTAIAAENIVVDDVAQAVFTSSPSAREEFVQKVREAEIPENIPVNSYVTKNVNKNIKILTDTGIEISFPAEYYKDDENIFIINNDDGTLSIRIDNVNRIINK